MHIIKKILSTHSQKLHFGYHLGYKTGSRYVTGTYITNFGFVTRQKPHMEVIWRLQGSNFETIVPKPGFIGMFM